MLCVCHIYFQPTNCNLTTKYYSAAKLATKVSSKLVAALSVFVGVGGWVKPSSWSVILRGTTVCPLWNSPPTSASAADATTCLRILHSMWIGTFASGRRFGDFFVSVGSELR